MLPSPFQWQDEHIALALPGAKALFTTRRGGCSEGPYASLNLGRWTDDDPDAVRHNRERLEKMVGARLAFGRQVHGAEVRLVSSVPPEPPPAHDGVLSATPEVAPMVLTADCLPVALAGGGMVGMLHAGWRGLAEGILAAGVRELRAHAEPGAALAAAIGPGVGPCCYEVSEEVHERFAARELDVRHGQNLDLKAAAREQLRRARVSEIHDCGLCTMCSDPGLFFSHRRDGGVTGRQAGVAWLV